MGRINKLGPCAAALALIFVLASFGCSKGSRGGSTPTITVSLSPSPTASMNVGSTLQFGAIVTENKTVITTPITFISNNRKILQFSPSGLACAGTWDTNFIVCSPGASGVATVLASGFGTPSNATTVYIHPQVTSITVSPTNPPCLSQGQTQQFEGAVFSGSSDITPFVGPLSWTAIDQTVAKTSTTAAGLQSNQVQVTAQQPGLTQIFASISGINGQTANFETCRVQSMFVVASSTGNDSLSLTNGGSSTLAPTVIDKDGTSINATGLTWISSQPAVVSVKSGAVHASSPGGAAIFPVCTPPGCNVHLQAIYSANVVKTSVTGSAVATTVYATSSDCLGVAGCQVSLIPISTQSNTAGAAISLPSPPNSMAMDPGGAHIYFGTAGGLQIMGIPGNSFTSQKTGAGKVLAVSPDGTQEVVSDTTSNPNVVYIVNSKAGTTTPLLLSGVTAAAFSPDSSTAYLLAGSTLYEYPNTGALQTITLSGPATQAAFLTTGVFGVVGSSTPSTISLFDGCDGAAPLSPNTSTVSTIAPPTLLASLPDAKTIAAVSSTGFTTVTVNTNAAGCPPPVTATSAFQDFGQGTFTPKQVLVSSDGARLYVISNLSAVLVYDFTLHAIRTIALNPSATPLSAALTLSGQDLYVGASDGTVHHLDAASTFTDLGQISVTLCSNTAANCLPNLVGLRP